jgi:hypothetical protein
LRKKDWETAEAIIDKLLSEGERGIHMNEKLRDYIDSLFENAPQTVARGPNSKRKCFRT